MKLNFKKICDEKCPDAKVDVNAGIMFCRNMLTISIITYPRREVPALRQNRTEYPAYLLIRKRKRNGFSNRHGKYQYRGRMYRKRQNTFVERLCTDLSKTELEYAIGIKTVLELYDIKDNEIDGAIISSVVPPLTTILQTAVNKIIGKVPMVVGPGIKTGLNILMDNPKAMGADLIVDSVAGINEYGAPLIIIDMGTATTVSVIDKDKNYIGGMIIPGLRVSLESLVSRTSQLPRIGLEAPAKTIGKNTVDCMKSGILFGNASMIDGLIDRIREEIGCEAKAVATGGLAKQLFLCANMIL